jgi:Leucine-rich repeat (LRR) protein
MLSLLVWFGALPKPTFETSIKVYSKLGGIFLGSIQRPCLKEEVDAYSVLRKLQDQVATWLCHPKMPPRYLALFVGTSRLTSPDFPFVDHLDAKSSQQVLDVLIQTLRIDAIWDEDLSCAKSRLASKGLRVSVEEHKLSILRDVHGIDLQELLSMEVEAYTFGVTIRKVWTNFHAEKLGCLHLFPHLEKLSCGGCIEEVDFKRLAQVKTLTDLDTGTTCLNEDVGLMTSLKALSVHVHDVGCIPTTIGLLTRLTDLWLMGAFAQTIPSEVGNLVELSTLTINGTNVSGSIPSEVCQLTKLTKLDLSLNPRLEGSLPDEFCNLKLLSFLNLHDTHVETNGLLYGWEHHSVSHLESYWTRQV